MQKRISVLIVSIVIIGLTLSLSGVLVSQAAPTEKSQNMDRPIPATDVKVVKKTLHPEIGEIKGKPATPPGKDKNGSTERAATGILGEEVTGNRYAVVIGICDYPGTANDLCNSDGDSYYFRKALIEKYGYNSDNIYWFKDMGTTTVGLYGVPTWSNIYNAVMTIKSKVTSVDDEVVFFFSGHGADGIVQDGDSETRDEGIVVHKDDGSGLDYIWDGELRNWFTDFTTTRIIFVFDSCLAGGMNDVAASGRVVAMATGETQVAYVLTKSNEEGLGEGVFSHYFSRDGLLNGSADGYNQLTTKDDKVVVEEAFDYAKEQITFPRQKPVISDNFADDLLL